MAVFNGTSAVTNNSTTVVFTGPTLSPLAVFPGAQVALGGYFAVIASITNTTTFELTSPYTGATAAAIPTTINTISEAETEIVTLNQRTADLLEELLDFDPLDNLSSISLLEGNGVIMQDATGQHSLIPKTDLTNGVDVGARVETLADRAAYDLRPEGFSVLVNDIGDGRAAVYFKMSNANADWSTPAYLSGPVGPTPDVEATVSQLPPGSTATVTEVPITGGVRLDFALPDASGFNNKGVYSAAVAYVRDDVVRHNGSSFIALQAVPTGTNPSNASPPVDTAFWQVLAAKGSDGTGTGDVVGPSGAVDGNIAVFDSTTGKIIKDGGVQIPTTFSGDTGSGGTSGLVPAPPSGSGASGLVLGATGNWIAAASVPRGHLFNLTMQNSPVDAENDLVVSSGECASDDASPAIMKLTTGITKRLDDLWAAGTGNGGRDTGSITNGTWHVFVIRNPTSNVTDVIFSQSPLTPTLPSGFTQKRRIGSFLRESGSVVAFQQKGDTFLRTVPLQVFDLLNPGTGVIMVTVAVPTGLENIQAILSAGIGNGTSGTPRSLMLTSPDTSDTLPTTALYLLRTPALANATATGQMFVWTNSNGQIRARLSESTADSFLRISSFGWVDQRGRCL